MKKFLLIVGIAAITVLSLSSCKKSCTCKESKSGVSTTVEVKKSCSKYQTELNDEAAKYGQNWTCK